MDSSGVFFDVVLSRSERESAKSSYEACRRRRLSLATSVVLQSVTVAGPREDPDIIEFGRFKVVRHRRELLADGRPVELGGRAFDTLVALIDARGSVLGKDELMSRVWPDQVVEENNLPAQISVLRKAFGADRHLIRTVAGRGYQFTGEICDDETAVTPRPTNLPSYLPELVGRETSL